MIRACAVSDVPEGEGLRVEAGVPIAVFRVDGEIFAVDDTCTHQDASLADGYVEQLDDGPAVECPLHASCFDLRTGAVTGAPARLPVRTHRVEVRDGEVFIEVTAGVPT